MLDLVFVVLVHVRSFFLLLLVRFEKCPDLHVQHVHPVFQPLRGYLDPSEGVLAPGYEDGLEVVFLQVEFWGLLEHDFVEGGTGLLAQDALTAGAVDEVEVVLVGQPAHGLAQPPPVLRFIFLKEVVLAPH